MVEFEWNDLGVISERFTNLPPQRSFHSKPDLSVYHHRGLILTGPGNCDVLAVKHSRAADFDESSFRVMYGQDMAIPNKLLSWAPWSVAHERVEPHD